MEVDQVAVHPTGSLSFSIQQPIHQCCPMYDLPGSQPSLLKTEGEQRRWIAKDTLGHCGKFRPLAKLIL